MSTVDSSLATVAGPFVAGSIVPSSGDAEIPIVNPSNGKQLFSLPAGSERDVDQAVTAARRAFDDGVWSEAPPSFRKRTLHTFANLIARESEVLNALDAGEMGKPISEPTANAQDAAAFMQFCAEAVDKLTGDVHQSDKRTLVLQRYAPRGLIAAIVPWNFPTSNVVLKVGPALAAGNSVVLKPSELATRSALRVAQLAIEAGLPPGVLNVTPGLGEVVGRALGLHPSIDMVAFTGSSQVGKRMLQYSGQSNMKIVMAECGGKSPQIVFDDGVDVAAAGESIARLLLTNQGQLCSVGSRLLVQRSIENEITRAVAAGMRRIVMGDALDPATTFGPLVSAKQRERVERFIEGALSEGAHLELGGKRAMPESGGYFLEPTLFRGVAPTACIAQEEIFGPVLSIMTFEDEEDAIRIANGTMYGLAAYVWTSNLSTGMRVAKAIHSPVTINSVVPDSEGAGYAAAWEPTGQSGLGVEGGLRGMESYLRRQLIWVNHG